MGPCASSREPSSPHATSVGEGMGEAAGIELFGLGGQITPHLTSQPSKQPGRQRSGVTILRAPANGTSLALPGAGGFE